MALLRSENIGELVTALAKAQGEFPVVKKDTKNYYGGKYAQLDAIVDAVRPALSKNGIAFFHDVGSDLAQRTASVTTYLQLGEQWIGIFAEASAVDHRWDKVAQEQVERFDTQTISIVWTYFKRTQLQAITGVAAEEDSDAQELVGNNPPLPKKVTPASVTKPPQQPNQPQTQQSVPPQERAAATAAQTQAEQGIFRPMPDGVLTCIIQGVQEKKTAGEKGKPYASATFNGRLHGYNFATAWDTGLFDALKAGVGKECQLQLKPFKEGDKFINVIDVLFVDGVEYVGGKPIGSAPEENVIADGDIPF
jgi:hypothetical protein